MDLNNENKIYNIMERALESFLGAHIEIDENGLIEDTYVCVDNFSDSWEHAIGDTIEEFLNFLEYKNTKGEKVTFESDGYTEEEFKECIRYYLNDELNRRIFLYVDISREEFLSLLVSSGEFKDNFEKFIREKYEGKIEYEDSILSDVKYVDVAKAAPPAFIDYYVDSIKNEINILINDLSKFNDSEIANTNIAKLNDLLEQITNALKEDIIPENVLEDFYDKMRDYGEDYYYIDLIDKNTFYENIIKNCQEYTYDLPEVVCAYFEKMGIDNYTINVDKSKLYQLISDYPNQICKDGASYTIEDVDTFVDLASNVGIDFAKEEFEQEYTR